MFDPQRLSVRLRARDVHGRLAALMLSVALCACGGGGGGGSPPPPSPPPPPAPGPSSAPTLTATAAASAADAGGQAITLHATVTDSSAIPSWTLSGPGALSAATGVDVQYLPPDTESLDDAATATVSVSIPSAAAQQLQVALAPVGLPGHHWTTARPAAPSWSHITSVAGAYVAIGPDSQVWRSLDGVAWSGQAVGQPAGLQLSMLGQGDGLMVANAMGAVYTSVDGLAWTAKGPNTLPSPLIGNLVGGNHSFVLYGNASTYTTTDGGDTWTTVPMALRPVVFGNGLFMGVGPGQKAWTSPDGLAWTPATDVGTLANLGFADGRFTALANGLDAATSDGQTWVSTFQPALSGGPTIGADRILFQPRDGQLGYQLPGQPWQVAPLENAFMTPVDIAAGPAGYVGVNSAGWVLRSADAVHWSTAVEGSFGELGAVVDFAGLYVALSDAAWILTSADGQHWSPAALPGPRPYDLQDALALSHGNGVIVAALGNYGVYVSDGHLSIGSAAMWISADAVAWRRVPGLPAGDPAVSITFDGQRFLAVGATRNVYASTDGEGWALLGNVTTTGQVTKIVAGGGGYVAIGWNGLLAWSADGVAWSASEPVPDLVSIGTPTPVATMNDVIWDGHRYLAAGGYMEASSSDGRTWTGRQAMGLPINALARCGDIDVAVGYGSVETSADGQSWHTRVWMNSPDLTAVTCGRGRVVATGWSSGILVSDH